MNSISPNMNIMIKAAEKASKVIIRDFGELEKLQVSSKGPMDFVTKSDGPFWDTCNFSNSPKSLIKTLDAFSAALIIIFKLGEIEFIFIYTFFTYSIDLVSTIISSPLSMNGGTWILVPLSNIAGL